MTFVALIENSGVGQGRRKLYLSILLSLYVGAVLFTTARLSGLLPASLGRQIVDFHDFYLASKLAAAGQMDRAYTLNELYGVQRSLFGQVSAMPWTYPPQFDLLISPLAWLPVGVAYAVFIGATLCAFILTLKRLAPTHFVAVLLLLSPAMVVTIRCGQNGFLTGTLVGLAALGLAGRRTWAGAPLGLMVIKPHLAVAFAVHTLLTRRWDVVLLAAFIVVLSTLLATAAFGVGVWMSFLHGVKEASGFLAGGLYPLHRMVSGYAMARSIGLSAGAASAVQLTFAVAAVGAAGFAVIRFNERQAIGIAAIASVMISPYAYDYDLPIFGVGIAILLGDLVRFGTVRERFALYALVSGVQLAAFAMAVIAEHFGSLSTPPSLGCIAVAATLALSWRILERSAAIAGRPAPMIGAAWFPQAG